MHPVRIKDKWQFLHGLVILGYVVVACVSAIEFGANSALYVLAGGGVLEAIFGFFLFRRKFAE